MYFPTSWQQFGEVPFLFQQADLSMINDRSIKKWVSHVDEEEVDSAAQSPDLNPFIHTTLTMSQDL